MVKKRRSKLSKRVLFIAPVFQSLNSMFKTNAELLMLNLSFSKKC